MTEIITLELPEETLERYRQSATAARRRVEELLAERIVQGAPPLLENLPPSVQAELGGLAELTDEQLWAAAEARLPLEKQRVYTRLLHKNSDGMITEREREKLRGLGDEARHLTLVKAQAYVLLRWRGYRLPTREDLVRSG